MKDVIPRPSHPNRRIIMCGINTSMFIEITNRITKIVNRLMNLSSFM